MEDPFVLDAAFCLTTTITLLYYIIFLSFAAEESSHKE